MHPIEIDQDATDKANADLDPDQEFIIMYALPAKSCHAWRCPVHYPTYVQWEKPLKGTYLGLPCACGEGHKRRSKLKQASELKLIKKMIEAIDIIDDIDEEFEPLEAQWEKEDWDFIRSLSLPSPSATTDTQQE